MTKLACIFGAWIIAGLLIGIAWGAFCRWGEK